MPESLDPPSYDVIELKAQDSQQSAEGTPVMS